MEDSFNVRVGKIFGSLSSSASSSAASSSSLSSLWCLTDDEIERRRWIRDKSPEDEDEVEEEEEEEQEQEKGEELESKNEESDWDIKASIGLDSTLDYEEEEDEYDKVAVGKEKPEDRVYMRDVMERDYGIDSNSGFRRDPRANHLAARIRLKEDSDSAAGEPLNPKPILKRKDTDTDNDNPKPTKRVRFDPQCHSHDGDHHPVAPINPASGLPDYLLNPSRYTRYTFDSSTDVNDHSNRQAYMDLLSTLKEPPAQDASSEPVAVTFIPRKKAGDNTTSMVDSCTQLVQQVGIGKDARRRLVAADADQHSTTPSAMEEDEPDTTPSLKPGRRYRVKPRSDLEDD